MKHHLTFKHVEPKPYLESLILELASRLEPQVTMFPSDSVSLHVGVEQNAPRRLYRVSVACEVPRRTLVAREEHHDPVATVREAFFEIERQLTRYKAKRRREHLRRPTHNGIDEQL